jgi:hypothetical protein
MNKLTLTLIAILSLATGVFAQSNVNTTTTQHKSYKLFSELTLRPYGWHDPSTVTAQSLSYSVSGTSVSALWLNDGAGNNFTAVDVPVFSLGGLPLPVDVVAIGAYQINSGNKTNLYAGTGLSVNLLKSKGYSVSGIVGLKGLNLTQNFTAAQGSKSFVFGLSLTVPIGN